MVNGTGHHMVYGNDELAKWHEIVANFPTIIHYFSHYWCLTYEEGKDKKAVYEEACVYGKENIKGSKKSFTNH